MDTRRLMAGSSPPRMAVVLAACFVAGTLGQDPTEDFFGPLEALNTPVPYAPIGGQNFTRCCLQALSDWQRGDRADVSVYSNRDPTHAFATPKELAESKQQFPCGAKYQDDIYGAPRVFITYDYCSSRCGGWQRSHNHPLTQWIQPFVGFILPAAVFCLNVPRKMVIDIADELFPDVLEQLKYSWFYLIEYQRNNAPITLTIVALFSLVFDVLFNLALVGLRAVIAASLGLINVVGWVIVVFSTAAPMILSGLYEASTDRQVLHAVERKVRPLKLAHVEDRTKPANEERKITYQVHMLYAVLVGNLELWTPVEKKDKKDVEKAPGGTDVEKGPGGTDVEKAPGGADAGTEISAAWRHVEKLVATLGDGKNKVERERTEKRLQTMLQCQASFGATIGAPIAFFLGSFLFSVFSNYETVGDNDTSHALAFGEWWMTIPHIAIVGGCLLAGNNPNTLEAIVSGLRVDGAAAAAPGSGDDDDDDGGDDKSKRHRLRRIAHGLRKSYAYFYKSVYQPVWMWERGRCKRSWLVEVQKAHTDAQDDPEELKAARHHHAAARHQGKPDKKEGWRRAVLRHVRNFFYAWAEVHPLEMVPELGIFAWTTLVATASILVIIPWVLAYVTSYYTPTIGLSCRTFTYVLYFLFQLVLTVIWYYDFRHERPVPRWNQSKRRPTIFGVVVVLACLGSGFTAIVGTFLQIVGVYRNCRCSTPMNTWGNGRYAFVISGNSAEKIYYANLYWLGGGVASIVLLILFCYLGWWYQRHWRLRFDKVVKDVLMTNTHKELERLKHEMRIDGVKRARVATGLSAAGVEDVGRRGRGKNTMTPVVLADPVDEKSVGA